MDEKIFKALQQLFRDDHKGKEYRQKTLEMFKATADNLIREIHEDQRDADRTSEERGAAADEKAEPVQPSPSTREESATDAVSYLQSIMDLLENNLSRAQVIKEILDAPVSLKEDDKR